jgi:hypothetical protein
MKLLSFFLILFSLNTLADDGFTRVLAESEYFKDFKREEMTAHFATTKDLLPKYACNGIDEFDSFWMPRKKLDKNALKVQLYKEEGVLVYQEGKYFDLNGIEVTKLDNLFVRHFVHAMKKLESIPETQKMLRLLEQAPYPVTIQFGGNSFAPKEESIIGNGGIYMATAISILDNGRMTSEAVPFYDIGVGGFINWNPSVVGLPGYVTLAHEMYHALDSVRGILDMRFIDGEGYERVLASEYRAVYMENIARAAAGLPYRTHYGEDHTGPGVLDENGKPRFISSPCLK